MAQSPEFKVFNPSGEYIAACKHAEDAAALASIYGDGAKIKHGHSFTVWKEGFEAISASESYDVAAATIFARIRARNEKAMARILSDREERAAERRALGG